MKKIIPFLICFGLWGAICLPRASPARADLACDPYDCPNGADAKYEIYGCRRSKLSYEPYTDFCEEYFFSEALGICIEDGNTCTINGSTGVPRGGCTTYLPDSNGDCIWDSTYVQVGCCSFDDGGDSCWGWQDGGCGGDAYLGYSCLPTERNLYRYCPDSGEWEAYCNPDPTCSAIAYLPIGNLDICDCTSLVGWTCDADSFNTSLDVHLYDGQAGAGGVYLGAV